MEGDAGERRPKSEDSDSDVNDDGWNCERRELTYQEARAVLESQQTILADIDEKAMRTVRTTVLLIGAIASAVKVAKIEFHGGLAVAGSVFLFGSLAFGLTTYDEADPYLGPNRAYLEQLAANEFQGTWKEDLIEVYGYWIQENGNDIEFNSVLLRATQILLFVGLGFLSLSLVF
ncbi:hypothetical protein [Halorussus ruber]|uniref:hypothetical protein n=1 Tax=Halorussus ruber TaxID=1126238 RepID=UPI001092E485|nr:hypothetical protein [Halorussus ruber]